MILRFHERFVRPAQLRCGNSQHRGDDARRASTLTTTPHGAGARRSRGPAAAEASGTGGGPRSSLTFTSKPRERPSVPGSRSHPCLISNGTATDTMLRIHESVATRTQLRCRGERRLEQSAASACANGPRSAVARRQSRRRRLTVAGEGPMVGTIAIKKCRTDSGRPWIRWRDIQNRIDALKEEAVMTEARTPATSSRCWLERSSQRLAAPGSLQLSSCRR
jgi:hypothetical protein